MNANLASIMPQVIAVWCEEAGHDVTFVVYTGFEDLATALPANTDVLFIGAFSESAQLSYAISNMYRQRGTVTVLGGPHARCYPEDATRYFDYVLGFTDKSLIVDVLNDHAQHRPVGVMVASAKQPSALPGVRARWKFVAETLAKAPTIKIVPMLASIGCPYTCSFCIDSTVDYHAFEVDEMRQDLRFLPASVRGPVDFCALVLLASNCFSEIMTLLLADFSKSDGIFIFDAGNWMLLNLGGMEVGRGRDARCPAVRVKK